MKTFNDGYEINPTDKLGMIKMSLACDEFAKQTNGEVWAEIKRTWADYGAGAWWWQIIINRDPEGTDSFQIGGNDRQKIIDACCYGEIEAAVANSIKEYPSIFTRARR